VLAVLHVAPTHVLPVPQVCTPLHVALVPLQVGELAPLQVKPPPQVELGEQVFPAARQVLVAVHVAVEPSQVVPLHVTTPEQVVPLQVDAGLHVVEFVHVLPPRQVATPVQVWVPLQVTAVPQVLLP